MINFFGLNRQQHLHEELLTATQEVLRGGIFVGGPYEAQLQYWLTKRTSKKYAILCHSGTQALEVIASYMLHILKYDKVNVPALTYPATANAMSCISLRLRDVDSNGIILDLNQDRLPEHTSIVVGLWGNAEYTIKEPISFVSTLLSHFRNNFFVEDGAQSWLAGTMNSRYCLATAISFDPTKNLPATGNGGAILTDSYELSEYARLYIRNGGIDHVLMGTNSRMSEQDCAHVLIRTNYIDQWQERRHQIAQHWISEFSDLPLTFPGRTENSLHSNQKFVIRTTLRNELMNHLLKNDVAIKIHYKYTLDQLPAFSECETDSTVGSILSCASILSSTVLSLPIYPELTDAEVEYITDTVKQFYNTTL